MYTVAAYFVRCLETELYGEVDVTFFSKFMEN